MKNILPEELKDNPFTLISKDWMLITAEKEGKVNMLTASWGGVGFLWNKPVATIYIRPSRYTKEFIDDGDTFSLCVLPKDKKTVLDMCGVKSGRDIDKVKESKLTVEHFNGTPWFAESRVVLICRKIYAQTLDPFCFTDQTVCDKNYKKDDFHTMYIAEIERVMIT